MFCPVCGSEVENDSVCENCNYHFENVFQNAVNFEEPTESPISITEELGLNKNAQQENEYLELNGITENNKGVNAIFQDGVKKLKKKPMIIKCVILNGVIRKPSGITENTAQSLWLCCIFLSGLHKLRKEIYKLD